MAFVAAAAWLGWRFTGPPQPNEVVVPAIRDVEAPKTSSESMIAPKTLPKRKPAPIQGTPTVAEGVAKSRIEGFDAETAAFIAIQEEVEELIQLALESDPAKHEPIYQAISSSDEELRNGAIEALVQWVGKPALPRMRQILTQLTSSEARNELQEAIEFLELPSIEEVRPRGGLSPRGGERRGPNSPRTEVSNDDGSVIE